MFHLERTVGKNVHLKTHNTSRGTVSKNVHLKTHVPSGGTVGKNKLQQILEFAGFLLGGRDIIQAGAVP